MSKFDLKILTGISLGIFTILVGAILVLGLTGEEVNESTESSVTSTLPTTQTPSSPTTSQPTSRPIATPSPAKKPTAAATTAPTATPKLSGYNLAEISKHNSASSCWMIINNKVYDITSYLNQHPAGALIIVPFCGKDGTLAYNTKGKLTGGKPHSSSTDQLLNKYYIGGLIN